MFPAISNVEDGVVVPMPTLPVTVRTSSGLVLAMLQIPQALNISLSLLLL